MLQNSGHRATEGPFTAQFNNLINFYRCYDLKMNFKNAVKTCLKEKYASFSGRASRSEFWFFYLFLITIYAICILLAATVSVQFLWVFGIFAIGMILPALGVTVRRLHDINKSGWFFLFPMPFDIVSRLLERSNETVSLIFLIISLGIYVYLLVLYCTDGDKKNNKFGKNIYVKTKKRKIKKKKKKKKK